MNGQMEESFTVKSRGAYNLWAKRVKNHLISIMLVEFGTVEHILQEPHVENVIISAIIFGKRHRECKVS